MHKFFTWLHRLFVGVEAHVDHILVDVHRIVDRLETYESVTVNKAHKLADSGEKLAMMHNLTISRLNASHDNKQAAITSKLDDFSMQVTKASATRAQLKAITETL